ncbi:hypothetical protein [Peribacillus huizhouensis]|uniref:Uncharacterized protein n=1 Tax=Peribacillus huizhouensis TaxID=1501239 RepID=A0ABR6CUQ5_9BACI|nr:hypothetical protein [Peribacillus huizhouensis]MBA9028762.1 hypothetical protein [Peribacillus huizhouensis]
MLKKKGDVKAHFYFGNMLIGAEGVRLLLRKASQKETPQAHSAEEASPEVEINRQVFRKAINRDGMPTNLSESELEEIMTRILLLQVQHPKQKIANLVIPELEYAQTLPLTYLVYHDEEPVRYLESTWKWSKSSPPLEARQVKVIMVIVAVTAVVEQTNLVKFKWKAKYLFQFTLSYNTRFLIQFRFHHIKTRMKSGFSSLTHTCSLRAIFNNSQF